MAKNLYQMIMENMADTVEAELRNVFEEAEAITNSLYIDREINLFLDNRYESPLEFYDASRVVAGRSFYEILIGRGSENIVMCGDNPTLVNGGRFWQVSEFRESSWYKKLEDSGKSIVLDFYYIGDTNPSASAKRRISLARRLDYYKDLQKEKLVCIDLSYSALVRKLQNMNFNQPVYLCRGETILLSNDGHSSVHTDFEQLTGKEAIGFEKVRTVRKNRQYYSYENFEISLDDVEGLNPYMEIEIALDDGADYSEAQNSIFDLFEQLGITDGFERTSYLELLENLNNN